MTRWPESHTGFHLSRAAVDSSHRKAVLRAVAVLELTTMTVLLVVILITPGAAGRRGRSQRAATLPLETSAG